ncbi:caldesmon [Anopheles maculipalpis]|uniref:caldesmon n=1 Tax=Anopheles maculipalpis TaxID=1496333 RepID=UPI002158AF4B|nr:caldesmon [Anopheles maculipalpis]
MIDDDEDDYEGYFLRPANEYNIKEKIIQANQESFAIPTPPSPRQHASGERRVTFREQLVDYEPDDYSSEDDGYTGGCGGGSGSGGSGQKKNAIIETVADVHRDGSGGGDGTNADTIIEDLHLDDRGMTPDHEQGDDEEEVVVEEEQLEGEYDEDGEGTDDRMEKHKTGVEGESVVSEEDDEVEEETVPQDEQVVEVEEEEEEEEPTDGSSMDTEIHNPESSEDISSSPLKTYRSEADSRSGSGDSQAEEANPGEEEDGNGDNEVHYEDDNDDDEQSFYRERSAHNGEERDSSSDGERPLDAHRAKRSSTCRRKCCRHKKSSGEKLPYYNGFRSEYGLSREELEEKKRRLEARRQRVRERQQRRTAEQRQKAQSNEEAFAAWLHGKLRNSINKHQNMYDVKQSSSSGRQQQQNPKFRRRNGIHTMQQISYG